MILSIETSTPVCSVALSTRGATFVEKRIEGKGVHSERTFTFIRELFERHKISVDQLEAVLFSHGPGSYTGLRIGAAAIKGLLFQRKVPLFTLPTLLGFSVPVLENRPVTVHSVIDARREHLYHQKTEIRSDGDIFISEPAVRKITDLEKEIQEGDFVTGTGWDRITISHRDKVTWLGTEAISAGNLILAWNHSKLKTFFQKRNPEIFEPEYLTLSQINNTNT